MKTQEANIAYNFYKNSLQFSSRAALNIKGKAHGYNQINQLANLISNAIEKRRSLEHRVSLLQSERLDRDMLEERALEVLGLTQPNELVFLK